MTDIIKPNIVPNKLTPIKSEHIIQRAQEILNLRGRPPYNQGTPGYENLSAYETEVLNDFMHYWIPFLVIPEESKS